jgi:predicted HicB family RNase H-like nuclease
MTNINIEIPDELHKKVKIQSAIQEITLKEFVINAIKREIKKKE